MCIKTNEFENISLGYIYTIVPLDNGGGFTILQIGYQINSNDI